MNEPIGCLKIWDKNCSIIDHKLLKQKTQLHTLHCEKSTHTQTYMFSEKCIISYPVFNCDLPFCLGFSLDCFIDLLHQVIITVNAIQKVSPEKHMHASKQTLMGKWTVLHNVFSFPHKLKSKSSKWPLMKGSVEDCFAEH